LSSGLRLGWVTAALPFLERLELHEQSTNLHASGISQVLVNKLCQQWGIEGFLSHCEKVADGYRQRRDYFMSIIERELKPLGVEYALPDAGMFLWLKLPLNDSFYAITQVAMSKKVILIPGTEFLPDNATTGYVRCSFSTATREDVNEGIKRIIEVIKEINENNTPN